MTWQRYGWLGLAVLGAGCSEEQAIPKNQPVQLEARLERFESCEALESYIETAAVLDMRTQLEQLKPSHNQGRYGGIPVMEDGSAPPDTSLPGSSRPSDYTDTNNQVAGVDEADFVKNDGTRLFVLSGQKLFLHRSWPASELRVESSLALEGWPREMLLDAAKNRLTVFSSVQVEYPEMSGGAPWSGGSMDLACPMWHCGYGGNTTKVTTVDVSDLGAPRVLSELFLPGAYDTGRQVGSAMRLVLRDQFRWPTGIRWYPEYSPDFEDDPEAVEEAIDELIEENEALIRAQTLARWLPEGRLKRADGTEVKVGYDCRDFHRTNAPTQLGFVTVASLNLDAQEKAVGRTALVAEPGLVYASADALYLASSHWWWWPEPGQQDATYLHKFDLRQPHHAQYVASGTVMGRPLNPFSLDEHEGVLRVATTLLHRVVDFSNPWGRLETSNRLSTFRAEEGQLKLLAQIDDLARGERIFSARFVGTRGYVVTFRQVDPLFTFDLSDPAHPRLMGELKVPGFSTYIHPLGDTHLLTLGVHVPENGDGTQRALKLSLFDVSDLAQPRETFTQLVGSSSSGSEALYEHKAFNYFPAKGLLAIPFTDWSRTGGDSWNGFVSELRVFRVDPATGFSPVGALSMKDVYQTSRDQDWSWTWTPHVRRSVMADDYVYAISDAGVRVSHVNTLGTPLATTYFSPQP